MRYQEASAANVGGQGRRAAAAPPEYLPPRRCSPKSKFKLLIYTYTYFKNLLIYKKELLSKNTISLACFLLF